jgi:hypothetical protein
MQYWENTTLHEYLTTHSHWLCMWSPVILSYLPLSHSAFLDIYVSLAISVMVLITFLYIWRSELSSRRGRQNSPTGWRSKRSLILKARGDIVVIYRQIYSVKDGIICNYQLAYSIYHAASYIDGTWECQVCMRGAHLGIFWVNFRPFLADAFKKFEGVHVWSNGAQYSSEGSTIHSAVAWRKTCMLGLPANTDYDGCIERKNHLVCKVRWQHSGTCVMGLRGLIGVLCSMVAIYTKL